ncbi:hypothetical protein [Cupriavidus taiwanensis]|uniref:hypothetical protein n=1 Tax=Cupriavidus taiwanensis TaxID=164546 RepID=UPI0018DD8246|nr:hypothetical protein [Cupriavidus taiwanensis]
MRTDLFTHPKVVRITSALKADRLRTVGGLMSVWCLFDVHSIDGTLEGYDCATVDEMIGWPGFADAMKAVGWLDETPEGLVLPEFETHNGQSAKRRAQDADRKRADRMSASGADKKRTREEKRREEKEEGDKGPAIPDWLPLDAWEAFDAHRRNGKAKKDWTDHAISLAIKELGKLRDAGNDPRAVIEQSILRGYTGLFEVKQGGGAPKGAARPSAKKLDNADENAKAKALLFGDEEDVIDA